MAKGKSTSHQLNIESNNIKSVHIASIQKKLNKTFVYLVPRRCKKKYNPCTELIIINEFNRLGYHIIPIYHLYIINILILLLTRKIDGIIVNSINILWKNKLLLKLNQITPIYWWFFDNALAKEKISNKVFYLAKNVSIFFNKNFNQFQQFQNSGIKPVWLDQGITTDCKYFDTKEYKYEIIFFGSISFDHYSRTTLLKKIDQKYNLTIFTPSIKEFKKFGFKNVFAAVEHSKIGEIVAAAKISLVLNATTKYDYCWSNRIHLMLGSGAFCITDYITGLENSYITGEDCIFVHDLDYLEETVDEWISDEKMKERNRIRLNGYQKSHAEHSYENRIQSLISHIEP